MVAHERNPSHNAPPERVTETASPAATVGSIPITTTPLGTYSTVHIRTGLDPHRTPRPTNKPSIPRTPTSAGVSIVNGHSGGAS